MSFNTSSSDTLLICLFIFDFIAAVSSGYKCRLFNSIGSLPDTPLFKLNIRIPEGAQSKKF